jgi:hypothetical protein
MLSGKGSEYSSNSASTEADLGCEVQNAEDLPVGHQGNAEVGSGEGEGNMRQERAASGSDTA